MSLVPSYVLATDGLYYKNPIIKGDGYFICFDDDDPPEIVMEKRIVDHPIAKAKNILNEIGLLYYIHKGMGQKSHRLFDGVFKPAHAVFFTLVGPIPPPEGMIGVKEPQGECVIYGKI